MSAVAQTKEVPIAEAERELTDGFHLIIDALKLNGLTTIYGVPGIPITDFGRMAQASGIRVLSFRHEQNAGYAAEIRDRDTGHAIDRGETVELERVDEEMKTVGQLAFGCIGGFLFDRCVGHGFPPSGIAAPDQSR